MDWSAKQYVKFEDERTRPARDLLAAVPTRDPRRVVDLGCGPGNTTELLLNRFPKAEIVGIDSSPDMVTNARARLRNIAFEVADLTTWRPNPAAPADIIYSNAVFQWIAGHDTILPRLAGLLPSGGSLAIQMPDNLDEPSHVAMREVARTGPWAAKLAAAEGRRTSIGSPAFYYDLLAPHVARVDVWRTVYNHPLDGVDAIVEWFKGSGLRPFLTALDPAERQAYLAAYRAAIAPHYPLTADGKVLLPFPRLFIVATR
ncbi:trans-aconitate 2-methyltransferase [Phreatobacter stygius]|uniref:Trans-aconitate 2-methyltransferase n=1 Tax=Phreatobacter stygius TaxID=1940610 RepID=A0A4D7B002_9HYPH|nr:trans-aconitate 2-methyltransferase [Phreatobacter stygius]QCI64885.1 trans-aconitate 2-methyltransferase [Phreatobacter stygius]